jgi:hypothetical protein
MKHLGDIQFGRQVTEDWVLNTNYVLKMRARKFVAAWNEEWLYPERRLKDLRWNHLGGKLGAAPCLIII